MFTFNDRVIVIVATASVASKWNTKDNLCECGECGVYTLHLAHVKPSINNTKGANDDERQIRNE